MIFPIVDLVPSICRYLSLDDIRALMCVDIHTRETIEPFTHVRTSTHVDEYNIFTAVCRDVIMFRIGHTVRSNITISSHIGRISICPTIIPTDYTGDVKIILDERVFYIYSMDGISWRSTSMRHCKITAYSHPTGFPVVKFADILIDQVCKITSRSASIAEIA